MVGGGGARTVDPAGRGSGTNLLEHEQILVHPGYFLTSRTRATWWSACFRPDVFATLSIVCFGSWRTDARDVVATRGNSDSALFDALFGELGDRRDRRHPTYGGMAR